jgi:predicted dehydrogenase
MFDGNKLDSSLCDVKKKLKVAFWGGGYDSAIGRTHRIALEMDQRFELVAGCFSRNLEKSRDSALKYGIDPRYAYSDIRDLINQSTEKIDGIIILTPQDQHFLHVVDCLNAGFPVISEKALVCSSIEALEIQELLEKKNGFLAVSYNYTGYPMIRELRRMIKSGWLGKIQQINIEMPQEGFARLTQDNKPIVPQSWRLFDGVIPTLSLDLGVHLHMMVRFLTDANPLEVVAVSSSRGNFQQIIDNVSCIVHYSRGIDCSIWYSKTAFGNRNGLRLRVFGDQGAAEWIQENPEYIFYSDNVGGKFSLDRTSKDVQIANQPRYQRFKAGHPAGFIEAYANYYFDVADSLSNFNKFKLSELNEFAFGIHESLEGLRMLEAIARSSTTKKWETV